MIVFVSNFLNHHQFPVASRLYQLTEGRYRFIETEPMPEWIKRGGYSEYENLPWLVQAWKGTDADNLAKNLLAEAKAVVWCNNLYLEVIRQRLKAGKLTFEFGERWFKRGLLNIFSPRLLKSQLYYHLYFRHSPLYRLNASAFAANDFAILHSYRNRMFKWGYFTKLATTEDFNLEAPRGVSRLKILFVSRFLIWKHPEIPVLMASELKKRGYDFELNMYGSGPEEQRIKDLIQSLDVADVVRLCGNKPNEQILEEMRRHDIFVFTSDKNEGWGAVVNEAMGSGCAVVASDAIGSVPFLIEDGVNGYTFKNGSVEDITSKVASLLDDPKLCRCLGKRAYETISKVWSPDNAAANLLKLIDGIENGNPYVIPSGPCSQALPIR